MKALVGMSNIALLDKRHERGGPRLKLERRISSVIMQSAKSLQGLIDDRVAAVDAREPDGFCVESDLVVKEVDHCGAQIVSPRRMLVNQERNLIYSSSNSPSNLFGSMSTAKIFGLANRT
jgi:hypothetical protein